MTDSGTDHLRSPGLQAPLGRLGAPHLLIQQGCAWKIGTVEYLDQTQEIERACARVSHSTTHHT